MDKTTCKSYVQHLEFLDAKSTKKSKRKEHSSTYFLGNRKRCKNNKQLKMYLKQKGLKISGSKAELIDRVFARAGGNLSVRDAIEDEESSKRRQQKLH